MDSELQDLSPKPESLPDQDDHPLLSPTTPTTPSPPQPLPSIEDLEKKYAAYVRHDVYGTMGRGKLPWTEKLLLGFAVVDGNEQSEELERPGVIVSNHVSHMDILYHMSSSFPSFVAKRSVGKLPLVGLISKCLGCVYVQRESKSSSTKGVSAVVNERIQEAHKNKSAPMMMLFPEGTTTNGDYILPFKTGAFLAKAPVLPVILKYPYERFSPAWDSISGARHVILLLCQFVNYMTVTKLPVYYPSQEEKDNPKLYAENVRRLMAREGKLLMSDIGLAEKRVYHAALNGRSKDIYIKHLICSMLPLRPVKSCRDVSGYPNYKGISSQNISPLQRIIGGAELSEEGG
ncbi:hypothetical protein M8C21_004801 [Ambrosia artemisiifolia]|uniref:Phospholipid/glycerol acyltransferase domain-containing protein n=1 Tax=Ambrosia artemisiifolia TaxID=4212 RepID=A0AAD5BTI8_AMBAR|nr:hypothetical protein M8C21_004801 [Ambrosia artemisiifolia]